MTRRPRKLPSACIKEATGRELTVRRAAQIDRLVEHWYCLCDEGEALNENCYDGEDLDNVFYQEARAVFEEMRQLLWTAAAPRVDPDAPVRWSEFEHRRRNFIWIGMLGPRRSPWASLAPSDDRFLRVMTGEERERLHRRRLRTDLRVVGGYLPAVSYRPPGPPEPAE